MPEYHAVETYRKLDSHDLKDMVDRCSQIMAELNWLNPETRQWLGSFNWDDNEGYINVADYHPTIQLPLLGQIYSVRFSLLVWTSKAISGLDGDWVEFDILFQTEEMDDLTKSPLIRYKPEAANGIWYLMKLISPYFPDFGTFFTNEAQAGTSWASTFDNNRENSWDFELGLVQRNGRTAFIPVPTTHFTKENNDQLWLARKFVWDTPPWE